MTPKMEYRCKNCSFIFRADTNGFLEPYCPKCKSNAVDPEPIKWMQQS